MTEADLWAVALAEAAAVEIILTDLVLADLARTMVRTAVRRATFLALARRRPEVLAEGNDVAGRSLAGDAAAIAKFAGEKIADGNPVVTTASAPSVCPFCKNEPSLCA